MKANTIPGFNVKFVCRDSSGNVRWVFEKHNLVVDEGMNFHINQFYLGNPWYMGLIAAGSGGSDVDIELGDTAAKITKVFPPNPPATNGWSEEPNYSGRQLLVFTNTTVPLSGTGTALSGSVIFTYAANSFFGGGFVIGSANNTGPLYSAINGSGQMVHSGDTVTATYEFDLVGPPQ